MASREGSVRAGHLARAGLEVCSDCDRVRRRPICGRRLVGHFRTVEATRAYRLLQLSLMSQSGLQGMVHTLNNDILYFTNGRA